MKKKLAVVQSNYIPWKGYFDLINMVNEFILYDDAQYTRRDWRNRNLIKTRAGLQWLTIPVDVKDKYYQKIRETKVNDPDWGRKHWASLLHNYGKARYFNLYRDLFEPLYLDNREEYLSQVNFQFMTAICNILGITTRLSWSMAYPLGEGKTDKLVTFCRNVGATHYVSGPSAKNYIDEEMFAAEGITVSYIDYTHYPTYSQLHGKFEHGVTILDLLFNEGPNAPRFMKSFGYPQGND